MNTKHAKALHLNLQDANSYESYDNDCNFCHIIPPLVEVNYQRQSNGHDCGIFIMMFMATIMKNVVEGRKLNDDKNVPYKAEELRQLLLSPLKLEINRRQENLNKLNIIDVMDMLKESNNKREKEKANEL